MKLKDLKKGDRFEITLKGTYVQPRGCEERQIVNFDSNQASDGTQYNSYLRGDLEVTTTLPPPAVGDQLVDANISYVLEAIIGDWWVVSLVGGKGSETPRTFKSYDFRPFTRIPKKEA